MKILAVVPYFYPAWAYGGPAKLVYDSSMYLAKKGHSVCVLTSDAYDATQRMPKSKYLSTTPNLVVRYFRNIHNTLAYRFNIFFTPGFFFKAPLDILKADIVHMHDFYTPQNAWTALICTLFSKPYILSVHGCLESARMEQRSLFKRLYLLLFGRFMLLHAAAVIATSENEVLAYRSYGVPDEKILRLKHGVDPAEFATKVTKSAARKKLKLPPKAIIVTFLGRIHAIKGLDLLVSAIAQLKTKNVHFVIAGSDDGYKAELLVDIARQKVSDKITLLGTCFGAEKAQLYAASDMFVYPSHSEGFSLGILEAAAAGLPLILTTGCHFDEVAAVGAGSIVPPDSKKLAATIALYAKSAGKRTAAGKNARKLITQKYSMSIVYDSLLALYQHHV